MSTEEGVHYGQDDYAGLFRRLIAETVDFLGALALRLLFAFFGPLNPFFDILSLEGVDQRSAVR